MKTVSVPLSAWFMLMVGSPLFAQQPANASAAEALQLEQANRKTAVAAIPLDEKMRPPGEAAQPAPAGTPSPNLRTSDEEKAATAPDPNRQIPELPADESVGQTIPAPSALDLPVPQATVSPALLPADPDEREAQQHRQNDIRRKQPMPKDESESNQH